MSVWLGVSLNVYGHLLLLLMGAMGTLMGAMGTLPWLQVVPAAL